MERSERNLSSLGRHVAGLQDRSPQARLDLAPGRARLSVAVLYPAPRPRRSMAVRIGVSLAAAALFFAALVAVWRWPGRALEVEIGGGAGVAGGWIAAPADADVPVRFSDGSQLVLSPGGRARVARLSAEGAEITLERGALSLSVVHRDATRWAVLVGPFRVDVVGTRFETRWDPVAERLAVALREGEVRVSGPVVGDRRSIRAGEELTVSLTTSALEVRSLPGDPTAPGALSATPADSASPTDSASPSDSPSPADSASPADSPSPRESRAAAPSPKPRLAPGASATAVASPPADGWRALARAAKYKEALAAAEKEGFDGACSSASAADLRTLGDTARLGGSPSRAVQAFTALRARFPGSPEAASAAFLLGRIAQDQRKDPAGAASWFTRYLAEKPSGELAEEAAGRLVEAEDQRGDLAAARAAAERYLKAHPTGAHSTYAKAVLARPAP